MKDISVYVFAPVVIAIVIAFLYAIYNYKIANSIKLKDKIKKVSRRRRVIRDNNHRLHDMNSLIEQTNTENFASNMASFFIGNLKNRI